MIPGKPASKRINPAVLYLDRHPYVHLYCRSDRASQFL